MSLITKPNLFTYGDYRLYLRDAYAFQKQEKRQFSFRFFSRIAGFKSPNFLKLVMDGKRNLSAEAIPKFAGALKLNRAETSFFRNLVFLNQAASTEEKCLYAEKIVRSKSFRDVHPMGSSELEYFSQWYYVAIRELILLHGFRSEPEWIAKKLCPAITPAEAAKALTELIRLSLIQKDKDRGYVQVHNLISTSSEVLSTFLAHFHREMIKKGAESIDRFPRFRRHINSATVALSADGAKRVKKLVEQFRDEILEISAQETRPTDVYELNLQFFPLTK